LFEKYYGDCFPKDFVTCEGYKKNIPRYYDKLYEEMDKEKMGRIKKKRIVEARKRAVSGKELYDKLVVKRKQLSMLRRGGEVYG
jgi:hypothetical protein